MVPAGERRVEPIFAPSADLTTGALAEALAAQETRLTSLEDRVAQLESGAITSTSGTSSFSTTTLASALEGFGVFIKSGLAQFGSLVFDRFVAAVDSAGTSSAGTVIVLAGDTVAQINNAYVTPNTKVFVTFNSPLTGSWYVSDKQEGSFRLVLSEEQSADVVLDYFLVQTEGQMATTTAPVGAVAPSVEFINTQVTPPPSDDSAPSTDSPQGGQPQAGNFNNQETNSKQETIPGEKKEEEKK